MHRNFNFSLTMKTGPRKLSPETSKSGFACLICDKYKSVPIMKSLGCPISIQNPIHVYSTCMSHDCITTYLLDQMHTIVHLLSSQEKFLFQLMLDEAKYMYMWIYATIPQYTQEIYINDKIHLYTLPDIITIITITVLPLTTDIC